MSPTPRTWMEYFAKELVAWREFRGMTQDQLAKAITFSSSLVAMVETCQRKAKPDFIENLRGDPRLQAGEESDPCGAGQGQAIRRQVNRRLERTHDS